MQMTQSRFTGRASIRVILFLSIFTFLYFLVILYVISDVYKTPVIGALYELLWLPMLLLLVVLPIASLIQLIKGNKPRKTLAFFALFTSLATILLIVLKYA